MGAKAQPRRLYEPPQVTGTNRLRHGGCSTLPDPDPASPTSMIFSLLTPGTGPFKHLVASCKVHPGQKGSSLKVQRHLPCAERPFLHSSRTTT